jgi:UDP-2,3-diacylglucosamine hydrolase
MTAIFLSDVHLRDASSVKSKLFIRFLQEKASQFERIYILGDLFDFWPGTNAYLLRLFRPVLQVLKYLVDGGHEIHYLEGNHDFRLGEYFRSALGIRVYTDEIQETWGDKRIYMLHGDMGNPKDLGYRALRYILRRDILHTALKPIPSEWIYRLGLKGSRLSHRYQSKNPSRTDTLVRETYRQAAESIFSKGYDVVLMGHTHLPDDVTTLVDGRSCRYINTGDWVSHFTYLEFDGSQFYTKTHPLKTL